MFHRKINGIDGALSDFLLAKGVEGISPFTIDSYAKRLKYFAGFLSRQGIGNIKSIKSKHIRLFLLDLQKRGVRPSSARGYYASLSAFFNWLKAERLIKQTPLQNVGRPRLPKLNIQAFSQDDIRRVLSLLDGGKFKQLRRRAMILLLLDTGIRLRELTEMELGHIDHEIIKIMGKGAKERIVRMGSVTQGALLDYLSARKNNQSRLWVAKGGKPLKREAIQVIVRNILKEANIKGVKLGPHTFRHTFAISYLRNGGDLITLQRLLGHSSFEMTRRYLNSLNEEDLIRAHQKFSPVDRLLK